MSSSFALTFSAFVQVVFFVLVVYYEASRAQTVSVFALTVHLLH